MFSKLHGRTRQQRYSKLADWDYIKLCVEKVREKEEEEGCKLYSLPVDLTSLTLFHNSLVSPIPIYGGGDCFSSTGYWETVNAAGVDGVMIARGALIKPWIFTEVKEKREWDIRSVERLELIRKVRSFVAYL
jgi:tRNA-dihydrouridine synthase 3